MLPRRHATGLRAGKAAREGAPSQKTRRLAGQSIPSRKGGFVATQVLLPSLRRRLPSFRSRCRRPRARARRRKDPDDLRHDCTASSTSPRTRSTRSPPPASAGEFYYHVQQTSFGPYVDQIGLYAAAGQTGWVFKVNGKSPPVGADAVQLQDGDTVLWYWAQFGIAGGPRRRCCSSGRPGARTATASTRKTTAWHADARGRRGASRRRRSGRSNGGSTQAAVGCVGKHTGARPRNARRRGPLERVGVRSLLSLVALALVPHRMRWGRGAAQRSGSRETAESACSSSHRCRRG